jgi:predicted ATPase
LSTVAVLPRAPRTNLRPHLGPFVGREDLLERVEAILASGARLLTLLGPPGIGKTRAAERVLELMGDRYALGGAWFCDLREVRDAAGLVHAIASLWPALDAAYLSDQDVDALVREHLSRSGRMLLVLDNFEQLAGGPARAVVRSLCQVAPELTVLVTSRERLAVEGEVVLELAPLACPAEGATPEAVLGSEAVRLLRDRITAAGGDAGSDAVVLAALAKELEGIPLAIELAAARTRVMLPKDLAARLRERAGTWAEGGLAALRSAIAFSWNLLAPHEQTALAECSVFAGGFTLEAAEQVLSRAPGAPPTVDVVGALRDKSLLYVQGEHGRLALYVSVREFAGAMLRERGESRERACRARHARHYASLGQQFNEARLLVRNRVDPRWRAELTRDRDNLLSATAHVRASLERARAASATGDAAESASVLAELGMALTLLQIAPADLCFDALSAALDALGATSGPLTAQILLARQSLFDAMGRFEESRRDVAALLERPDLDPATRACALVRQGIQLRYQSLPRQGWESHVRAARELETLDMPRLACMNFACMGRLQCDFGDEELARDFNGRAAVLGLEVGDPWLQAFPPANIAQLEQELGNFQGAADLLGKALARFRTLGEPQYEALYSAVLGDLHFEWGHPEEARRSYALAAPFLSGWLAHRGTAILYASWGALEAQHGDARVAEAHVEQAERSMRRADSGIVRLVVELGRASLRLRAARDTGDKKRLSDEEGRWRARLASIARPGSADQELAACSIDVRFAIRMLAKALGPAAEAAAPNVKIPKTGAWFEAGGGRVDLSRRGPLRRVLSALAEHHVVHPDEAVSQDALLAQGWPGERVQTEAGGTRLRVAIASLRRMGLRDAILTRDEGYLLDPKAGIVVGDS